jgi:hypothetical protein
MRPIAKLGKSPLAPLFQRGELAVAREEFPNTFRANFYFPSWSIPPLKKGDKGGFEFFHMFRVRVRGHFKLGHPHLSVLSPLGRGCCHQAKEGAIHAEP